MEGLQCLVVSFLLIDSFQISDNGRIEFGKFVAGIDYEFVERLFGQKFARVEILSSFETFPRVPGFPPGEELYPRRGNLPE